MPNKVKKKIPNSIKKKFKAKKKEPNQYSAPARYKQIKDVKRKRRDILKELDNS